MPQVSKVIIPVVAALLLAGCGEPDATVSTAPSGAGSPTGDIEGSWELVSGSGPDRELALVDGYPITIQIDGTQLDGTSACNDYGATLSHDGDTISIGQSGMTGMACQDNVMALEAAFHDALAAVDSVTREGDELILTGPDVRLRFTQLPPVPVAELVGTTWVLETLVDGETASSVAGEPATLTLASDGTLTGSTGCRDLTGAYVESTGQIVANELAAHGECPDDMHSQDAHIVEVIGDGFRAVVEGDTLTLSSSHGQLGLVYQAS